MKYIMILMINCYQKIVSKYVLIGRNCIFYPTCSQYSLDAYKKYNFFKGSFLTVKRICRCHPYSNGGYDPLI